MVQKGLQWNSHCPTFISRYVGCVNIDNLEYMFHIYQTFKLQSSTLPNSLDRIFTSLLNEFGELNGATVSVKFGTPAISGENHIEGNLILPFKEIKEMNK